MTNFHDLYIFVNGGAFSNQRKTDEVFCYQIGVDRWARAPSMTKSRSSHSSCVLVLDLYVFGGYDENGVLLDTIERLSNVNSRVGSLDGRWESFHIDGCRISSPLMVPLKSEKILILGHSEPDNDFNAIVIKTRQMMKKVSLRSSLDLGNLPLFYKN